MSAVIRTYKYYDINEVKAHLLIVGQLTADCANCKAIGIDYLAQKACPECKSEFKYIATRQNEGKFPSHLLKKLQENQPNLELIDYSDFKLASDRSQAHSFFKN
jgi:hypothetical protein